MFKTKLNQNEIRHVIAQNANRIQQLEKELDYLQLLNQMLDYSLSTSQISENYAVE